MVMIVCNFSEGLDEMPSKQQGDIRAVLKRLSGMKRFSVFEASANMKLARTMTKIFASGYVEDAGGEYPWTTFKITDAGKAFMESAP